MKVYRFFLLILGGFLLISVGHTHESKRIFEFYQGQIKEKYQHHLKFYVHSHHHGISARAGFKNGKPIISYGVWMLENLSVKQTDLILCHEIGHFLGELFEVDSKVAMEGEADYFSGLCLKNFYADWEEVESDIVEVIGEFGNRTINLEKAKKENHPFIQTGYLTDSCRVLTVYHGFHQLPRPVCFVGNSFTKNL